MDHLEAELEAAPIDKNDVRNELRRLPILAASLADFQNFGSYSNLCVCVCVCVWEKCTAGRAIRVTLCHAPCHAPWVLVVRWEVKASFGCIPPS